MIELIKANIKLWKEEMAIHKKMVIELKLCFEKIDTNWIR